MADVNPAFKHAYEQPEKRGMSGCAKAAIIIGILGVVGMVVCCGGGFFFMSRSVTEDPDRIQQIQSKILQWDGIQGLEPIAGFDMWFFRMAMYGSEEKEFLFVMDSRFGLGDDVDQARRQMDQQMSSSMNQEEMERTNVLESMEVQYDVRGEPVTFSVKTTEGVESKEKFIEVAGIIEGEKFPTLIFMRLAEAQHSEEDIKAAIESIR